MKANDVLKKINFPVEKQKVFLAGGVEIPNRKAIVRTDKKNVLGIATDSYNLLTNKKVFSTPLEVVTSQKAGYDINRFNLYKGGRSTFVEALSKDDFKVKDLGKDEVYKKRIILANSYDCSSSLKLIFGAWRLICKNGAGIWHQKKTFRIIHVGNSDGVLVREQIMENLKIYDEAFEEYMQNITNLASKKVDEGNIVEVLQAIKYLSERKVNKIVEIYFNNYKKYKNLLGVYHAITQYYRDYENYKENGNIRIHNVGDTIRAMKGLLELKVAA